MTEDRAISLNAVIATIYNSTGNFKNNFDQGFFADKIRELPPVTPTDEEMAMQYQRGYIDGFHEGKATFEPKAGHWIVKGQNLVDDFIPIGHFCSECGKQALLNPYGTHTENLSNYCPYCGKDMRGDENADSD